MDLEQAAANFRRGMTHADNLVAVHRRSGSGGRGRRVEEVSVNRAIVVIVVATWQAAVEDMTNAILSLSEPPPGDRFLPAYKVIAGRVQTEVAHFSTPNAQNSRKLLQAAGFDPRQHWTWTQRGGRGVGVIVKSPSEAEREIDDWLKVRHAIAHGDERLPAARVLQAVRRTKVEPTDPSLRLVDANECIAFFRRIVRLTGTALAGHLSVAPPKWN